ncbi:hypothetical protein BDV96DRAFT_596601 [Lophiotrema nucula]|uniref:Uncharacterized protein n=1 Tax=Lophiotrema nucula TaxID=690887 RepID=A0A6A5ZIU7_9PLEO|nr:hypothetical protein BDV96DRAFT_596601 [Lophiotrema nucula]
MPWLNTLRHSLAKIIAPSDENPRYKLSSDKPVPVYTPQPKSKKDSLSPQSQYYTPKQDKIIPSEQDSLITPTLYQQSRIPTPPPLNKKGRVASSEAVKPKVYISNKPESPYKPFLGTEFVYKTRAELIAKPIEEQLWGAWKGDVGMLEAVLDVLLREDVMQGLERHKEKETERRQSADSVEGFLNGDSDRKSIVAGLDMSYIFETPTVEKKDVEIVIAKFDKKLYVKKPDGRYYKVKVTLPNRHSRRSVAMVHRQSMILDEDRELEGAGYLTDESEYEFLQYKDDEDDRMAKEVKEKLDLHRRVSRDWTAELGMRVEWDDSLPIGEFIYRADEERYRELHLKNTNERQRVGLLQVIPPPPHHRLNRLCVIDEDYWADVNDEFRRKACPIGLVIAGRLKSNRPGLSIASEERVISASGQARSEDVEEV